jgi:phospholipid/cholesterol/gamma-HCH transport system permease protein
MIRVFEAMGRGTVRGFDELGYAAGLLGESLKWLAIGRRRQQPVRLQSIIDQMMQIGIEALPIATLLSTTIGIMLAIQSLYSLGLFGAESFAYVGIGLSVTREFAPLIIGILISGRSGSALAARIATMTINQEVDALRVIGVYPVRFLVAPALVAMVVMVPALTVWSCLVSLAASGLYVSATLDTSLAAYATDILRIVSSNDILHGLGKSLIFAVLIALIGVVNGSRVTGGAEGVGRATTRAVVHSISAIIVADMIFAFAVTG